MIEAFFLADVDVDPCEVVEFVLEHERKETYHAGIISHLFLRVSGASARFLPGRLYIATTSAFVSKRGQFHEAGFLSERMALVMSAGELDAKSDVEPRPDFVERVVAGGYFYPSRDLAMGRCDESSETS
ncbi:MAG: hypothetical protein P8P99_04915 [Maricaulis sp.]|nr:hypothetical protein [Maricaulis sp.]